MKLYGDISKTEQLADGTLKVWGYASTESVDEAGEIVTADAMKAALPDYMKFGAVREMHQLNAVGTAIEIEVQDDGRTYFGAHVIDSNAVKKVQHGVFKGFSIGGKVTSRDSLKKTTVTGIKLTEISLVDRPCNAEATFTMFKADAADAEAVSAVDELAKMLDAGTITPERLVELAKAEHAPAATAAVAETPPAAATPAAAAIEPVAKVDAPADEALKKGMYAVSSFASVLTQIACMASDAEFEAQMEGDSSPVPAQLRTWVSAGVEIFKAMSAEETAEMVANLTPASTEVIETVIVLADKPVDLVKVDAPVAAVEPDALAKVSGELDLAKAAVATVTAERDALQKALTDHLAKPAPGKALLMAITKSADAGDLLKTDEPDAPAADATGEEKALYEIKKGLRARAITG